MLDWRPDMLDAVLKMKHQGARLRLALTTRCSLALARLLACFLALVVPSTRRPTSDKPFRLKIEIGVKLWKRYKDV
jgi:hypothetical protein